MTNARTAACTLAIVLAISAPTVVANAKPVGCPIKGTGKGTDGLSRMQVEITTGMPGSTIVCHYYNGRSIILQNAAACAIEPLTRSEVSGKTKIDICEAAQPTDLAVCTARCGP